jgi:ribosomal protein S18 acetylase RimI-like enzyme
MKIEVRDLGSEERDLAVALWSRCELTRPWNNPAADFDLALTNPSSTVLGGFAGSALVASLMVGFDGHRGWVYYVAVDEAHRGRGFGKRMMHSAEAWLREKGAPKLQFMVREGNDAALDFYAKLGFERQPVITLGRAID